MARHHRLLCRSTWRCRARTVVFVLLLSFIAFDVLDLDGSNLPAVTSASRAIQADPPAEAEHLPANDGLDWSQLRLFAPDSSAAVRSAGGRPYSRPQLPGRTVIEAVPQALPRGNLSSPASLVSSLLR